MATSAAVLTAEAQAQYPPTIHYTKTGYGSVFPPRPSVERIVKATELGLAAIVDPVAAAKYVPQVYRIVTIHAY